MKYLIVAGALCTGFLAVSASAADDSSNKSCIRLSTITDTRVIDEQTILVNHGGGHYDRIDLTEPCPGLSAGGLGFGSSTHLTDEMCMPDVIRTREPAGPRCAIKDMRTISSADAKQLEARAK